MKIAITADLHLTAQERNPERFQALADILRSCGVHKVQLLIIAGDLFDQNFRSISEFEKVYSSHRPRGLRTVIIPGNHDSSLKPGQFISDSLMVYTEPTLQPLNDNRKILFLPYQPQQTMGEVIAPFADQLRGERWILISHGDWTGGCNSRDPYEKGSYLPLTRGDVERYQPELIFLGHIHLPQSDRQVWYPGSPCPLNVSETGLRRFLIYNSSTGEVSSPLVNSPVIYFHERFVMLPVQNDLELLEKDIKARIQAWNLPPGWEDHLQLLVEISGAASSDRSLVLQKVLDAFTGYSFCQGQEPNLEQLVYSPDPDRAEIALRFKDWLEELDWGAEPQQPAKSQILEAGLRVIYEVN